MGKRKRKDEDSDDELLRKIRRLERRIKRRKKDDDYDSDYSKHNEWDYEGSPFTEPEDTLYLSDSDDYSVRSVVSKSVDTGSKENTTPITPSDMTSDPKPSTSSQQPELPVAILEILGESKEKEETFGPKIREEVSKRWGKIIMEGLNKEKKEKLMDGVLIPENFQLVKAPKLNPEIAAVLSESTRNRDKRLETMQNHLGIGIAAITNLMSSLIDGELTKEEVIKKLSEAGQILLDLHSRDTSMRRQLITYSLDKKFFSMVRNVKRDSFLFGENLGEKIKATKTAERSGLQIKRKLEPQPSTSYRSNRTTAARQGNSTRGPPRQYSQRGRPGGPRAQASAHATRRHPPSTADRYSSTLKPNNKSTTRKTP